MSAYEFLYQDDNLYSITGSTLIVIDKSWGECPDEDKALLTKILGSVKLSPDKVQVIHSTDATLSSLSIYKPSKVISFGVELSHSKEMYKHQIVESISLIQSDSLSKLDDAKKKSLWGALKQMFPA